MEKLPKLLARRVLSVTTQAALEFIEFGSALRPIYVWRTLAALPYVSPNSVLQMLQSYHSVTFTEANIRIRLSISLSTNLLQKMLGSCPQHFQHLPIVPLSKKRFHIFEAPLAVIFGHFCELITFFYRLNLRDFRTIRLHLEYI